LCTVLSAQRVNLSGWSILFLKKLFTS
ncbi:small GTP-binding domain protein, partial [Chlamydia psittaci 08-2626_L3]